MTRAIGSSAFQRVLQRKRIDERGEHAHVIARDAVHSGPGEARAAEDVASADDYTELDPEARDFGDLAGDAREHLRLDAVVTGA